MFACPSGAVRRLIGVGIAGVVSVLIAGCSAQHPETTRAPAVSAKTPVLLASVGLRLPVERYLFSDAEENTLQRAAETLVESCMRNYGFDYVSGGTSGHAIGPRSLMDRRYGLTDEKMARADGYHLGDRDPRTHPVQPAQPPKGEARTVLMGDGHPVTVNGKSLPEYGCSGAARARISGSVRTPVGDSEAAQDLNNRSFMATRASPRVVGVFRQWSDCMKGKGFSYPDPLTAMSDPRFQGEKATPLEIRVATADVGCKRQANLVGVWFSVETAFQKSLIAKEQPALKAALQVKKAQLAAASAVDSGR